MKRTLVLWLIILIAGIGCSDNHPTGIYKCSKQVKSEDESSGNKKESANNITKLALKMLGRSSCLYDQLEFKGNNTVVITTLGQTYSTSYVIDEEYIRIKTDQTDLLLKKKDDQTLIGEGFIEGVFLKE